LKSIGEWKEGKKCGLFEDIVRVRKQVYYVFDVLVLESNVKREATVDEDNDTDDDLPSKRCNVCVTP